MRSRGLLAELRRRAKRWVPRANQIPPDWPWFVWLILAGRGWGKTRTGAEWAADKARRFPGCRIALVAQAFADGRDTMVEGESGLLSIFDDSELRGGSPDTAWNRSMGELFLANGSRFRGSARPRARKTRGSGGRARRAARRGWAGRASLRRAFLLVGAGVEVLEVGELLLAERREVEPPLGGPGTALPRPIRTCALAERALGGEASAIQCRASAPIARRKSAGTQDSSYRPPRPRARAAPSPRSRRRSRGGSRRTKPGTRSHRLGSARSGRRTRWQARSQQGG